MSALTSKVRIYDLAKDLKIDTKRLIEEVRREGVDVSVPSNSVSKELAEKIREKYFPKQPAVAKRQVKIVKKAARPVVEEPVAAAGPELDAIPVAAEVIPTPPFVEEEEPIAAPQAPAQVVRRLAPAARAVKPAPAEEPAAAPPPQAAAPAETPTSAAQPATPSPTETVAPTGRQVRVLRPTAAALNAGIRPGERAPAPPPPTPTGRLRERAPRGRVEYTGTPGETATPQTTYIPPPDAGRRKSRRGSTRRGKRKDGKGGRFDRDDITPPAH